MVLDGELDAPWRIDLQHGTCISGSSGVNANEKVLVSPCLRSTAASQMLVVRARSLSGLASSRTRRPVTSRSAVIETSPVTSPGVSQGRK